VVQRGPQAETISRNWRRHGCIGVRQSHFLDRGPGLARYNRGETERCYAAQAFGDLQITPQTIIVEGERAVAECTARCTHSSAFRGIAPTGKQLSYAGITIYRVDGGKIVEAVYLGDRLGLWQQLGLTRDTHKLAAEVDRDSGAQRQIRRGQRVTLSHTGLGGCYVWSRW
jgi:predicted ester cyclase